MSGQPIFAKLHINLDKANIYKAGDRVSGTVSFTSDQPESQKLDVGSIIISISGKVTTTRPIRRTSNHRKTVQLFNFKMELLTGPKKLIAPPRGASSPTFPFNFTLPFSCSNFDCRDFQGTPFFNPGPHQPLPPSFSVEKSGLSDKGSVLYELKAELLPPTSNGYYSHGNLTRLQEINVYTPRSVQEVRTSSAQES